MLIFSRVQSDTNTGDRHALDQILGSFAHFRRLRLHAEDDHNKSLRNHIWPVLDGHPPSLTETLEYESGLESTRTSRVYEDIRNDDEAAAGHRKKHRPTGTKLLEIGSWSYGHGMTRLLVTRKIPWTDCGIEWSAIRRLLPPRRRR